MFLASTLYYHLHILDSLYDVFSLSNIFEIREFSVIKVTNDWPFFNTVTFLYAPQGQRGTPTMSARPAEGQHFL